MALYVNVPTDVNYFALPPEHSLPPAERNLSFCFTPS